MDETFRGNMNLSQIKEIIRMELTERIRSRFKNYTYFDEYIKVLVIKEK